MLREEKQLFFAEIRTNERGNYYSGSFAVRVLGLFEKLRVQFSSAGARITYLVRSSDVPVYEGKSKVFDVMKRPFFEVRVYLLVDIAAASPPSTSMLDDVIAGRLKVRFNTPNCRLGKISRNR
ncbi:hypothetical protein U1Q18_049267 [Sarracenia purpurea var. burkii]